MHRTGLIFALLSLAIAPVGAGASGHGSMAMLAFTGVFFLANAVIRPGSTRLSDPMGLAMQVVTAAAFAALLVGFGQTIRALARIETEVGLEGWLIVAAWGALLGRIAWKKSTGERAMKKAETALKVVHETGTRRPPRAENGKATAPKPDLKPVPSETPRSAPPPTREPPSINDPALRDALGRLNVLPETGAEESALIGALATISGAAPPDRVFAALRARASVSERDRRALAIHATDPWVAERQHGKGEPATAFEEVVAAADAVALSDFATRALALVDETPAHRADMPEVARLLEIADQIEDNLETEAELLVALAHKLEDLSLEEDGAEERGDDA